MDAPPASSDESAAVMSIGEMGFAAAISLAARFNLELVRSPADEPIAGSFWGAPEAGILGRRVMVREDTPVHSFLHEMSHIICMSPAIRDSHTGNAESDDLEEAAVCYLQILLADHLAGVGSGRLIQDMDAWGYSFRLGSTRCWFEQDAEDARAWLLGQSIITTNEELTFRLRQTV